MACPRCGSDEVRKNGKDRRGAQVHECRACGRSFTALTATPFAHHGFPAEIIALAVRWYLRYRLSYADVAELLAERGVQVHRSTIYLWVQRLAHRAPPPYQEEARPSRHAVEIIWHTDETYVKVGGRWRYVDRAVDEQGQVVDVYVSARWAELSVPPLPRKDLRSSVSFHRDRGDHGRSTPPETCKHPDPLLPWHQTR